MQASASVPRRLKFPQSIINEGTNPVQVELLCRKAITCLMIVQTLYFCYFQRYVIYVRSQSGLAPGLGALLLLQSVLSVASQSTLSTRNDTFFSCKQRSPSVILQVYAADRKPFHKSCIGCQTRGCPNQLTARGMHRINGLVVCSSCESKANPPVYAPAPYKETAEDIAMKEMIRKKKEEAPQKIMAEMKHMMVGFPNIF